MVRVPLASGLLTGKFTASTDFAAGDHRQFNRNGEEFDKGETFAGIDYEKGIAAVEALKKIFPNRTNLAPIALKWILQFDAVSCIIPGASNVSQVDSNISAINIPDLSNEQLQGVQEVYENYIKQSVHQLW
ncbi:MAG: aldo/keto reductase [Ferruginibacter sp.]